MNRIKLEIVRATFFSDREKMQVDPTNFNFMNFSYKYNVYKPRLTLGNVSFLTRNCDIQTSFKEKKSQKVLKMWDFYTISN